MITVHKFTVPVDDAIHEVEIRQGYDVTRVEALTPDVVTFWARVDTEAPMLEVKFRVIGTGHLVAPRDLESIVGTAIVMGGALVWHLVAGEAMYR